MKKRYSVTVAFTNLANGVDVEFDSYNDAIHFAHAVYKSPDCHSVDIWTTRNDDSEYVVYSKTKQVLYLAH